MAYQRVRLGESRSFVHANLQCGDLVARLVACLFGFYGISTFVGYLTPNPF